MRLKAINYNFYSFIVSGRGRQFFCARGCQSSKHRHGQKETITFNSLKFKNTVVRYSLIQWRSQEGLRVQKAPPPLEVSSIQFYFKKKGGL